MPLLAYLYIYQNIRASPIMIVYLYYFIASPITICAVLSKTNKQALALFACQTRVAHRLAVSYAPLPQGNNFVLWQGLGNYASHKRRRTRGMLSVYEVEFRLPRNASCSILEWAHLCDDHGCDFMLRDICYSSEPHSRLSKQQHLLGSIPFPAFK